MSLLDRRLTNFEWLFDDDTTLHFSLNQVDFCIGTALERLHSAQHQDIPAAEFCKQHASKNLVEGKQVA